MAFVSSDDAAVTVSASLSASLNTPDRETCLVPLSFTMVASEMALATVGARLTCCGCPLASISFRAAATGTQRSQPRSA